MSKTTLDEIFVQLDRDFHDYHNGKWDYDNPKPIDQAKQAILDWHNKQIEAVLDRLENKGLLLEHSLGATDSGRVRRITTVTKYYDRNGKLLWEDKGDAELTLAVRRILSEPKILNISYSTDVPAAKGYASAKISTELVDAATTRIMEAIQQEIAKARIDEIQRYDHMTYHSRDEFEEYIQQRQAELSQTLKEHKEE